VTRFVTCLLFVTAAASCSMRTAVRGRPDAAVDGIVDSYAVAFAFDGSTEGTGAFDVASDEAPLRCGFVPASDLTVPRMWYGAALLRGGNVLVTGGSDGAMNETMLASTEIYDFSANTFTASGNLLAPRQYQTATPLLDGRVLIAGGMDAKKYTLSAELFDPDSGTVVATSSLAERRIDHTATLLPSGKVLIAGSGFEGTSAELYDPVLGGFAATGTMTESRSSHTATLLQDGRVLLAGGRYVGATAEVYDERTGRFSAVGALTAPRSQHTATLLANGTVLLAGGEHSAGAELFDPGTGTFAVTGSMTEGRSRHSATLLPNGMVLIAGGQTSSGTIAGADRAELYDPSSGTFTRVGSMAVPRVDHAAILLPNGKVLMPGSCADRFSCPRSELFQCE
jgi:hypothetical protein